MSGLIERLEKATGPDRELDRDIALATIPGACKRPRDPDGEWIHIPSEMERDQFQVVLPFYYTASLDAALTLVPEGWTWMVSNRAPTPKAGRAYLNNRQTYFIGMAATQNPAFKSTEDTAATPAIALCIAALRARSATAPGAQS